MKKAYSKPKIFFDSFELSQSIAVGCSAVTNAAQNVCVCEIEELGLFIFADRDHGCTALPQPGAEPCYEVPTVGWNVFGS